MKPLLSSWPAYTAQCVIGSFGSLLLCPWLAKTRVSTLLMWPTIRFHQINIKLVGNNLSACNLAGGKFVNKKCWQHCCHKHCEISRNTHKHALPTCTAGVMKCICSKSHSSNLRAVPTDSCHILRSQVLITQNQRQTSYFKPLFSPPNCYSQPTGRDGDWQACNEHPQNLGCRIILPEQVSYKCHPIPAKFSNTSSSKLLGLPTGALCRDASRRKESPRAACTHTHTHSQTVQARHMLCIQVPQ